MSQSTMSMPALQQQPAALAASNITGSPGSTGAAIAVIGTMATALASQPLPTSGFGWAAYIVGALGSLLALFGR